MSAMTQKKGRIPEVGEEVIAGTARYKLIQALGEGGFGKVFLCEHHERSFHYRKLAVKVEKYSCSMLHVEVAVLKAAAETTSPHFCQLIDCGYLKPEYIFMVTSLLGKDLSKQRALMPGKVFSRSTAVRLAQQTLKAIESLHKIGYISRDIKPGNFSPGLKANRQHLTIYMFDFGLAKKYVDKNNNVAKSRGEVGWRGTVRYGSLNAHARLDLGRSDDLESWCYMIIEFVKGSLPWRMLTDRSAAYQCKQQSRYENRSSFLANCPTVYDDILKYIDDLFFESSPDYDKLHTLLDEVMPEDDKNKELSWDWEEESSSQDSDSIAHVITKCKT